MAMGDWMAQGFYLAKPNCLARTIFHTPQDATEFLVTAESM